ncbi:MAG TPA: sugar phosphate isomerase/epimerase family protein [Caldimonas sp.]|jgi:sugar phosphate isomerase/epimerase|nr:sugar phosphate isomerase/epimerase family protein [Caldimonas sp.]HEX4236152.1 sugar phosphate isomerase/epimerase family protein [Caldimonas sp.]
MKIALCNEVLAGLPLERQCEITAALGYDGLEIAPFTLSDAPDRLESAEIARVRRTVESFGLVVTGLHWLLVAPPGLSVTDPDPRVRAYTLEVVTRIVRLCAELGGSVLVHGSPKQRQIAAGESHATARGRLRDFLAEAARVAEASGVTYCIEPLGPAETALINTVAEAAELVREIGRPPLRTMIDCSAAGAGETQSVPDLIDAWLPTGLIAHVQVNDPNRRAPGQGEMRFAPIFAALHRHGYDRTVAVEPFDYVPDGTGAAAFAAGYLRGIRESLA